MFPRKRGGAFIDFPSWGRKRRRRMEKTVDLSSSS